jgi:hypothetical protein
MTNFVVSMKDREWPMVILLMVIVGGQNGGQVHKVA